MTLVNTKQKFIHVNSALIIKILRRIQKNLNYLFFEENDALIKQTK